MWARRFSDILRRMTDRAAPAWAVPVAFVVGGGLAWGVVMLSSGAPPAVEEVEPFLRTPQRVERDLVKSEAIASAAAKAVRSTFIEGLRRRDPARIAAGLSEAFLGDLPRPGPWTGTSSVTVQRPAPVRLEGAAFVEGWTAIVGALASIERARWRVFRSVAGDQVVIQRVHFELGGVTLAGHRRQLAATITVELERESWRIRRWAQDAAVWSESQMPPFVDVSDAVGFSFVRSAAAEALLAEAVDSRRAFMTGGLTAADVDGDGFTDLIASRGRDQVVLFRNDGRGGFERRPLPAIEDPDDVGKHYLFVDLDGDGASELVSTAVVARTGRRAELGLYRGVGTERVEGALAFDVERGTRELDYISVIPCDVDGDGDLDLLAVGYSHHGSRIAPKITDARDGLRNLLFINRGGLKCSEESQRRGIAGARYSLIAGCRDFDGDGDADLIVGNDYGPNDYYQNLSQGRFQPDLLHPFHTGPSFTMGLAIADYDNTGRYTVSVSNMYSHEGNRIVPLAEGLLAEEVQRLLGLAGGNRMFDDQWRDVTDDAGVALADWAWGQQFFDVDNDADKDLYVVNGYTSHSDPTKPDY